MKTGGRLGEIPSWYSLLVAARYLRVPPWELARRPVWWREIALLADEVESSLDPSHALSELN
jgi:hypothetical protein